MRGVVATLGRAHALRTFAPPLALPPVAFVLAWHRRNDAHPAQRWLRSLIAEVAAKLPS